MSLAYYLRVVAAMWMRAPADAGAPAGRGRPRPAPPVIAGGRRRPTSRLAAAARGGPHPEIAARRGRAALATLALGLVPDPLFDLARDAGARSAGLF